MTKSILLFFALLLPFHIYAQQDTTKRATTTVFFGDQSENNSDPNRYHSNNVKFGIIEIFGGQYGLFYERELNRLFSIEVGGGLTGRNFTGTLFRGLGQEEDVANQNIQKSTAFKKLRKS